MKCSILSAAAAVGFSFLLATSYTKRTYYPITEKSRYSSVSELDKKYTDVCFLMTHNATNNEENGFSFPNQYGGVTYQLNYGVRGLMIDTYDEPSGNAVTYHGSSIFGSQRVDYILSHIALFLKNNPQEVVSIIFENNGSNAQLDAAIKASGLDKYAYVHNGTWPTLRTMVTQGKRAVLFVEQNKTPQVSYLNYAWAYIFDTRFDYKSVSEFDSRPNRGAGSYRNLALINHWVNSAVGTGDAAAAATVNSKSTIINRINNFEQANDKLVNFVGVDFYDVGDCLSAIKEVNARRK